MEVFDADIKKDEGGRLTVIELPFFPREVFKRPKGTLYVSGTINHIEYRCKLLARGNGRFAMTVDKALQKALGYDGGTMKVYVTMAVEEAGKETGGENFCGAFVNSLWYGYPHSSQDKAEHTQFYCGTDRRGNAGYHSVRRDVCALGQKQAPLPFYYGEGETDPYRTVPQQSQRGNAGNCGLCNYRLRR